SSVAADAPRVSVVIPLYNLGRWVGDAIESVLGQTVPAAEIETIVVDDGSTDGGGDVVRRYEPRVRYARQENRGVSAARNAGLRLARGAFVTFLDADDRFRPEMLAAQLACFAARPEVGVVYTGYRHIDAAGAVVGENGWARDEGDVLPRLALGNLIHPHLALVRRTVVERTGGFDEALSGTADWDLWLRIARMGVPWACVDRPLAEYRLRPEAMHQDVDRMLGDAVRVLDKLFADPELRPDVRELRPLAYQRAHLGAAAAHLRAGDRVAAGRWLRCAAEADASFLTTAHGLRLFCRWLLPPERQRDATVVREGSRLLGIVAGALDDLYAVPDLPVDVRRTRWRARLALWRLRARLLRKRLGAAPVRPSSGAP
ncbi:MAG TPA: glycosyltransferase, partial [Candidatus Binatia bacterium]|nr:glycosyltransferase [Candidatus Binatia bacterium]